MQKDYSKWTPNIQVYQSGQHVLLIGVCHDTDKTGGQPYPGICRAGTKSCAHFMGYKPLPPEDPQDRKAGCCGMLISPTGS